MIRSRGDMASPRHLLPLLAALQLVALCTAGPLGPLPNVTSAELGLKEGSCALGDVVYMAGDEFPGSEPCERCTCAGGGVQCARQRCEPRPGCKALHRPDHCCPTYQCECEQEGRVYGNGEKLVDPLDPCRVCYCQGGEVVCRRIACFVRDDCTPRLVPGRCCPEYDNCPLRGVTSLPGMSSSIPSASTPENIESPPSPPKENIKQEITIKEITPVSEIPVITDVKIKEILPSPSIEVAEYSSSKSPLIPREATSEKNIKDDLKTEAPSVIEVHSSLPVIVSSPDVTQFTTTDNKDVDAPPSKISFSTQDSINSSMFPSNVPVVATMGIPPVTSEPIPVATTKAPIMEEDDTFDRNPAFPPLPDDLAVLRNLEDEIIPEQAVDNEHVSSHDVVVASLTPVTEAEIKEPLTTTPKDLPDTTTITTTVKPKPSLEVTTAQVEIPVSTEAPTFKESPMLNLRSAIPTEILNSPSLVPEDITSESDEKTTLSYVTTQAAITTTEAAKMSEKIVTEKVEFTTEATKTSSEIVSPESAVDSTTTKVTENELEVSTKEQKEQTTSSIPKSNIATEVTSQTELSSLPIETSDQNPPAVAENTTNDKDILTTLDSLDTSSKLPPTTSEVAAVSRSDTDENSDIEKDILSTLDPLSMNSKLPATSSEVITVSRSATNENSGFENVETTEFVVTLGSSETATDAVELIKISASPEKSAAIIESADGKNSNYLTDLINLVRDVATISNHTDEPETVQHVTTAARISDSEELIPVNAGYKSKNKNFNQNSITEIPIKSKIPNPVNKQKVVEIEDDDESVTDSPPPYDKVEPTTRRPIIDNVSDDVNIAENKTGDKKDIEIITKSYVPTINHRRPTKVVMKKSNDKPASEESLAVSASAETSTDTSASNETPTSIAREAVFSETENIEELANSTSSAPKSDSPVVTTVAPKSTSEALTTAAAISAVEVVTTGAPISDLATTTSPSATSSAQ